MGSLFTALGYLTGAVVFYLAARRKQLATEGMAWLVLFGAAAGVVGAKLSEWLLVHWPLFTAHPAALLDPRLGGRGLLGGILSGWLAVAIAKRRMGIRRSTGDLFALALPAGEAVGRIGCFLNGCCYGTAATAPWKVFQHGEWRHPAQLYSAAVAAGILAALLVARDRLPREGDLFRLYLLLFGGGRFVLEFFRDRSLAFGGVSTMQWVCLELVIFGAATLLVSYRRAMTAQGV